MSTHSNFCEDIKRDVDPSWAVVLARLGQIVASDGSKLDRQALQEDGEDVGHEDNEKEPEAERSSSGHISSIIARVDVCHRNLGFMLILNDMAIL